MKRITQQINPKQLKKKLKRNKSQNDIKNLCDPQKFKSSQYSQTLVQNIIHHILQKLNQKLQIIIINQDTRQIINKALNYSKYIQICLQPQQHQNQQKIQIITQQQPKRINYDPICGFNKLITITNKKQENFVKKQSPYSSLRNISKENYQNKLKETNKLIPLQNIMQENQKQPQCQLVQRDRRIYQARNLLIKTTERQYDSNLNKNDCNKLEIIKKKGHDDYFYGYSGEKYLLNTTSKGKCNYFFGGNHILKTSYKINNSLLKEKNKDRPSSLINDGTIKKNNKNRQKKTINLLRQCKKKENHRNGKRQSKSIISYFYHPTHDQGLIKTMMEVQFKKNYHNNVRLKEKQERLGEKMF